MVCRLARRTRTPPHESLQDQTAGRPAPNQKEKRGAGKKSPSLGTVGDICRAWTEAHPTSRQDRQAGLSLKQLAGNLRPHELTPLHFQSLVARWRATLARATAHNYRDALMRLTKHIAALTGRHDLTEQIPRVPPGEPRKRIATPEEMQQVLTRSEPWLTCAILLANHGTFRASDCLRIAPFHYNAEAHTLTIDQKKGGHTVSIPVSAELADCLERAPHDDDPHVSFIDRYKGKRVKYDHLNKHWNKLTKKAGIETRLTFHDLRRTTAVALYEVSKDLRIVEQMLGHKSLTSTVRYLEHRDAAKLKPYLDSLFTPKGPVQ